MANENKKVTKFFFRDKIANRIYLQYIQGNRCVLECIYADYGIW